VVLVLGALLLVLLELLLHLLEVALGGLDGNLLLRDFILQRCDLLVQS
jgi:hypothetical protein